jgi:hypothetical protein
MPVSYCDLVGHPSQYDGQLVLTEAVYERGIHADILADQRCQGLTLPKRPESKDDSLEWQRLERILKKGAVARVDVIGVFRADLGSVVGSDGRKLKLEIGPDMQSFMLEIQCLLAARALPLPTAD